MIHISCHIVIYRYCICISYIDTHYVLVYNHAYCIISLCFKGEVTSPTVKRSTGEVKEDATAFTRVAEKRRKHMSFGISRRKAVWQPETSMELDLDFFLMIFWRPSIWNTCLLQLDVSKSWLIGTVVAIPLPYSHRCFGVAGKVEPDSWSNFYTAFWTSVCDSRKPWNFVNQHLTVTIYNTNKQMQIQISVCCQFKSLATTSKVPKSTDETPFLSKKTVDHFDCINGDLWIRLAYCVLLLTCILCFTVLPVSLWKLYHPPVDVLKVLDP